MTLFIITLLMILLINDFVNKKHLCNVAFINVISKVFISRVFMSTVIVSLKVVE